MEFCLLGPVEVVSAGRPVPLGGPKPRALLAVLLLQAGRVVSTGRLVDVLWGDEPPRSAHALVQTYVYGLRRALTAAGDPVIETRPPGYVARIEPARLDAESFHRLVADGRRQAEQGSPEQAAGHFRAALDLWRGTALGGVAHLLRGEAERLEEARLAAVEEWIEAELSLGREGERVGDLAELVRTRPTRERLRGQLMRALYRLGRQADALAVFHEGRQALADELGVDPAPELRALYEAMLRADPSLSRPAPAAHPPAPAAHPSAPVAHPTAPVAHPAAPAAQLPASAAQLPASVAQLPASVAHPAAPAAQPQVVSPQPPRSVPAQLPRGVADFTGRDKHLAELADLLTGDRDTMPVCVISGKGGVGKSALAVKLAYEVAHAFPDGQLYAALRGVGESPASPLEVLTRFLRALGVPPATVPETVAECTDLYRSLLSGRRLLVVLDDAADEAQVRPLLPGSPSCAVLITARRRLVGLDGVHLTDLNILDTPTALDLLTRIAGADRVGGEPQAAERIVTLCGRLPLALRTAGARLAARPHWPLARLADRLDDEHRRLDELAAGDLEVRASVALSYHGLDAVAKRAFRLLGMLGTPEVTPWMVAALLDVPDADGEEAVERLVDAQLLDHVAVDAAAQSRYRLHDLLRVFAAERAEAEEPAGERAEAVTRVLRGWLWLIGNVTAARPPGTLALRLAQPPARPVGVTPPADLYTWFTTEGPAVVTAVERAAAMGLHEVVCDLAAALSASAFAVDARFEEWRRTHEAALQAARRAGDAHAEAIVLLGLGQLRHRQDRYTEGQEFFTQALPLLRACGDTYGQAVARAGIGTACRERGELPEALTHLLEASRIFRSLGYDSGTAHVGRLAGAVLLELGDFEQARTALDDALAVFRRLGSKRGEGLVLRSLGLVHRALGEAGRARELSEQALDRLREAGDPLMAAYGVQALAKARIRCGDTAGVLDELRAAMAVCEQHGDRFGVALIERTIGEQHLAAGRAGAAREHLDTSVALWDRLGLPLFRARTLRDLAAAHDLAGAHAEADRLRAEALAVFARFGTREYAELGGRPGELLE